MEIWFGAGLSARMAHHSAYYDIFIPEYTGQFSIMLLSLSLPLLLRLARLPRHHHASAP